MSSQPIDPVSDPRIHHKTAVLNGYTYHYLYAEPKSGQYSQTVFLVWNVPYLDMSRRIYCAWTVAPVRTVADEVPTDPWMARFVNGVEIPDPGAGENGVQGCGARYDGVWWHGQSISRFPIPRHWTHSLCVVHIDLPMCTSLSLP
jgi:hypothetical protein